MLQIQNFYADDTIMFSSASSLASATKDLQSAFNVVQQNLHGLRLVLNIDKSKVICFTRSNKTSDMDDNQIVTLNNKVIERVATYKYLGFFLEENLSFKHHIECLTKKLRIKLGFLYRNKCCFSFGARKKIVQAVLLSVIDYGDILYMHANSSSLKMLDSVYHAALRFVSNSGFRTHHCKLYEKVGLSSLYTRRMEHWYMFLYKAILHDLPPYLCSLMVPKTNSARITRSSSLIMYNVPRTRTTFGESAFKSFAPSSLCKLQEHLKLESLITLNNYKSRIKDYLTTN